MEFCFDYIMHLFSHLVHQLLAVVATFFHDIFYLFLSAWWTYILRFMFVCMFMPSIYVLISVFWQHFRDLPRCDCAEYGGWDPSSFPCSQHNFSYWGIDSLYFIGNSKCHFFDQLYTIEFVWLRAMVELTSLQPQLIHVLEMAMLWSHELGYLLRFI